jgi:hypothetical protein
MKRLTLTLAASGVIVWLLLFALRIWIDQQ